MHGDEVRWRPTVLPWQVPFRTRCRPKNRAFLVNEPRYILSRLTIISGILMASCVPHECWILESDLYDDISEARNTKTSKLQPEKRQDRACRIELADLGLKFPLVKSILSPALWKIVFVSLSIFELTALLSKSFHLRLLCYTLAGQDMWWLRRCLFRCLLSNLSNLSICVQICILTEYSCVCLNVHMCLHVYVVYMYIYICVCVCKCIYIFMN